MSFGKKLCKLRESYDLSQRELAEELEMGASTIGQYELDKREPSFKKLRKIKNYFNVSYDYLLGNKEEDIGRETVELKTILVKYNITIDGKKMTQRQKNGLLMLLEE